MSIDSKEAAFGCAGALAGHNGTDTVVIDLRRMSTWTDFFVVTTCTSSTHLRALARHAEDYLGPHGYSTLRKPRPSDDESWCLLDFGDLVVHVMTGEARAFYELESLWFEAEKTSVAAPSAPTPAAAVPSEKGRGD